MSYSIQVITTGQQYTTSWSGGSTTQIAIYPDDAQYSNRNFTWRLSAATVDAEESTFTSLPGISRILMVTYGEARLEHAGHHSVFLQPYQQDAFSGDWTTKSVGKVSDFNLMLAATCKGRLTTVALAAKNSVTMPIMVNTDFAQATSVFYCVDGSVRFAIIGEDEYNLQKGDALLISIQDPYVKLSLTISNLGDEAVHVIRADMQS